MKAPILPVISSKSPPDVRKAIEALRVFFSKSGAFPTIKDMMAAGIIGGVGPGGELLPPSGAPGTQAPLGFTVTGAFATIVLQWNLWGYPGHSHTEIWRAQVDDLGEAVKIATTDSFLYADTPPSAALSETYYYWVRFVNIDGIPGPYNGLAGTAGRTATDPGYMLEVLTDEITESQLYQGLNARINLIDGPEGLAGSVDARVKDLRDYADGIVTDAQATLTTALNERSVELTKDMTEEVEQARSLAATHTEIAAEAVLDSLLSAKDGLDRARTVTENYGSFRDAVAETDPETGSIRLYAVDYLATETAERFSEVEQTLTTHTSDIAAETEAREALTAALYEGGEQVSLSHILELSKSYADTDSAAATRLATLITQFGGNEAAALSYMTTHVDNNSATATNLATLQAEYDTTAAIVADLLNTPEFNPDAAEYLTGEMVTFTGSLYRAIQDMTTPVPDPTNATYWELLGDYSSLAELVAANAAAIETKASKTELNQAKADIFGAEVTEFTAINAQFGVVDTALADRVTSTALTTALNTTKADIYGAEVTEFTAINAEFTNVDNKFGDYTTTTALNTQITNAVADGRNAAVSEFSEISAQFTQVDLDIGAKASLDQLDEVSSDADRALARQATELRTEYHALPEAVAEGLLVNILADAAEVDRARVVQKATAVAQQDIQTLSTDLTAESQARLVLAAEVETNHGISQAGLIAEQTARADAISAEAEAREVLTAEVHDAETGLSSKASSIDLTTAVSNIYGAEVSSFTHIDAEFTAINDTVTGKASIAELNEAIATEETARATAITRLSAALGDVDNLLSDGDFRHSAAIGGDGGGVFWSVGVGIPVAYYVAGGYGGGARAYFAGGVGQCLARRDGTTLLIPASTGDILNISFWNRYQAGNDTNSFRIYVRQISGGGAVTENTYTTNDLSNSWVKREITHIITAPDIVSIQIAMGKDASTYANDISNFRVERGATNKAVAASITNAKTDIYGSAVSSFTNIQAQFAVLTAPAFDSGTSYAVGVLASLLGVVYESVLSNPAPSVSPPDATYWQVAADMPSVSSKASITDVEEALADETSASATSVKQLAVGEIDNPGGTVAEIAARVTDTEAQYTVKLDNNGFMSGFGLASTPKDGVPFSEMYFMADRHAFINPAVAPKTISGITRSGSTATATCTAHGRATGDYVVHTGAAQKEYNGSHKITVTGANTYTFPVAGTPATPATLQTGFTALKMSAAAMPFIVQDGKVYMDVTLIKDATITSAKVESLAADKLFAASGTIAQALIGSADITSAMIAEAAITNAKIDNAAITTAKIGEQAITTAKIGDAAITTAKIANVIQSNNFVAGSAGWRIQRSGDAEFNGVIISRPNIKATGVIGRAASNGIDLRTGELLIKTGYKTDLSWYISSNKSYAARVSAKYTWTWGFSPHRHVVWFFDITILTGTEIKAGFPATLYFNCYGPNSEEPSNQVVDGKDILIHVNARHHLCSGADYSIMQLDWALMEVI